MRKYSINRKRGAAIITAVIFFVVISVTMAVGLSSPVVREYVTARDFEKSKGAYYLSEAGMEDVLYRIRKPITVGPAQEVIMLGGNTATTTIYTDSSIKKTITSWGDILRNTRRVKSTLTTTTGESFVYGVWAGPGGVYFQNNSSITGNLYSAGPVCGGGSTGATCSGGSGTNIITGTSISGGTTGLNGTISNIQNQGGASMYSGNIKNSTISGGAYCNTISGSSISTCQTLVSQPPPNLPITAQDIANWEAIAVAGGTATCSGGSNPHFHVNSSGSLGPIKIPCRLEVEGANTVVTLTGPVWVTGDIEMKNNFNMRVDPALTGQSVVLIADNPANRTSNSRIIIENNPIFTGASVGNSWVMLISENKSASIGGAENAIDIQNNAAGDLLLYARLGNILLQNNASVKEVTGYKLTLKNNANVIYSSGLQNALFTSGPGGVWGIQDWKEGQ
ncbi:MAG: hypothetical protein WAV98_01670 [Minisyncoccia bacterium]